LDISSSDIRNLLASSHSVRYLVPEKVEHYIRQQGLYR
jgi:nicotinate-nucleotide adenylyltransferase